MNHKLTHSTTVQFDTQVSQKMDLPRPAVQGLASGIFFLTFFGAFWGFISAINMNGTYQAVAFLLVGLVTLFFFIIGVLLLRYSYSLPKLISPEDKAFGKRIAMWFGIIFGIEIVLLVGRQVAFTSVSWMPLFLSFKWPSVVYALDILAWDWFYGLSLLFAAAVFKEGRLQLALRITLALSGILSLAGLIFLPFGDIQLRTIGIFGYAGLGPMVYLLVALVLGQAKAPSQEAVPSLGSEFGSNTGRQHPQEGFKEDSLSFR